MTGGSGVTGGSTAAAGGVPVPVSATLRVAPGALSVSVSVALFAPVVAGAKRTTSVQDSSACRTVEAEHVVAGA